MAAPPNWRQQVAAKYRELASGSNVKSPEISQPYTGFLGVNGGNRPMVCVRVVTQNIFGSPVTGMYSFYFNDGKVEGFSWKGEVVSGFQANAIGCNQQPMMPFTEVAAKK